MYPQGGSQFSVTQRLAHLIGREVDVAVHHFPPNGQVEESAGGGSCLLGGACLAHQEDPAFLFSQKLSGPLTLANRTLMVGQTPIGFTNLDGHFGQLVAFSVPNIQDASLDELLAEATSMADLLVSLRGSLKAKT